VVTRSDIVIPETQTAVHFYTIVYHKPLSDSSKIAWTFLAVFG